MCFLLCLHLVQGSGVRWRFRRLFLLGRCRKVVFKSRVTSHNNDMSSPLEKGRAKGAGWIHVADNVLFAGIVSHVWYEILRLSPHLFWLGLFTHRVFSSAQDDDTRGRKSSHLGDTLHVLELAVLYYDTSSPLREGARQRRRMDPRSGVKEDVRLPVSLKRHPGRSGGIFLADW